MDLHLNTAALDLSAAAVNSVAGFVALEGPDDFKQLVLGTTEPLAVDFLTGASAYETWSNDATYVVSAALGQLTATGLESYATATLSSVTTHGKSGNLALTTTALSNALRLLLCGLRTAVGLTLQITVTDPTGAARIYAQLTVQVNGSVT